MQYMPEYVKAWYPTPPEKPDYEKMAQLCMEALETHPQDREYLLAYAAVYLRYCGKIQEALAHCRKYMPTLTIYDCRDDMVNTMVYIFEELNDLPEAIAVLEQHVPNAQNPYFVYDRIVELAVKTKDMERVIKYGQLMGRETQLDTDLFGQMAEAFEAKKEYLSAHEHWVKAGQFETERYAWLWNNAGRALALAGQEDEAMFYFQMAVKMNPGSELAHYFLGQVYQNKDDVYRALHHYTEALKIRPDFPEVYNNLAAISYYEDSNINEAIANLEKALEASPDKQLLTKLHLNLARLYKKIADYDRHEYYKGRLLESLGFDVDFGEDTEDGDEEEEQD